MYLDVHCSYKALLVDDNIYLLVLQIYSVLNLEGADSGGVPCAGSTPPPDTDSAGCTPRGNITNGVTLHDQLHLVVHTDHDSASCVGYLQEQYSPIPPPRKKQRNKQEPSSLVSNNIEDKQVSTRLVTNLEDKLETTRLVTNIEDKPETTRLVTKTIEDKPETTSLVTNKIDREYKSLSTVEKRSNASSNCQSELSRLLPDCWTSVKKKLKRSPSPESEVFSTRHTVLNADKSTISNRDYHLSNFIATSGPRAKFSDGSQWCRTVCVAMFRGGMKLKERLLVGVSVATVLFTLLLVVDLQMDTGMVGHRFMPTHARVKFGGGPDPPGAAYNSFRNRLLQKTHR